MREESYAGRRARQVETSGRFTGRVAIRQSTPLNYADGSTRLVARTSRGAAQPQKRGFRTGSRARAGADATE